MPQLTIDQLRALLPQTATLRPLLDRALAQAVPDPRRAWSAAGEVCTLGARVVDPTELARELPEILDEVKTHFSQVCKGVLKAMQRAAMEEWNGAVEALLATAELESGIGRPRAAWAFVEAALRLRDRVQDRHMLLPATLAGARLTRQFGRHAEAEELYRESVLLAESAGMTGPAARAWIGLGSLALDRGLWDEALSCYDRAETLVEGAEAPLPEEWHVPLNRSIVARRRGDLEAARRELDLARSRAERHADEGRGAILWNAEGQLHDAVGRRVAA